jgi:hypothetical protein
VALNGLRYDHVAWIFQMGFEIAVILKKQPTIFTRTDLSMASIRLVLNESVESIETPIASNTCIWLQLTASCFQNFWFKESLCLCLITT